jgi:hypothetical protein
MYAVEDSGLLGYDAVLLGYLFPVFQRNVEPSFSRVKESKKSQRNTSEDQNHKLHRCRSFKCRNVYTETYVTIAEVSTKN